MKYRTSRSPPRNFKVNLIDEPPLTPTQKSYLLSCVPRIGRNFSSADDIQLQLSLDLCKYLQKSVGVSVVVKGEDYNMDKQERHLKPITFRFTMNEFLFKVWIHEPEVEFENSIREQ